MIFFMTFVFLFLVLLAVDSHIQKKNLGQEEGT